MSIIWVFKPIGWTPKDCIDECQKTIDKKMAFAGRLDPMASGLLPLIIHQTDDIDGRKRVQELKESLQGSYKTYQFKLIIGLESDTFDILGLIKRREFIPPFDLDRVKETKSQLYPPYSSYPVFSDHYNKKVPLWQLSKEGRLPDKLPEREVDIQSIKILDCSTITNIELSEIVTMRINSLLDKINYRNGEILTCWEKLLEDHCQFTVLTLEARVSTGTYIRTIGDSLGGIVYDIFRTSVGDKVLEKAEEYDKFKFVYPIN